MTMIMTSAEMIDLRKQTCQEIAEGKRNREKLLQKQNKAEQETPEETARAKSIIEDIPSCARKASEAGEEYALIMRLLGGGDYVGEQPNLKTLRGAGKIVYDVCATAGLNPRITMRERYYYISIPINPPRW